MASATNGAFFIHFGHKRREHNRFGRSFSSSASSADKMLYDVANSPYFNAGVVMTPATLEERVAALERRVGALLANRGESGRAKDWRRTRGVFTGDDLMKQVFEEGRKIRDAERKR